MTHERQSNDFKVSLYFQPGQRGSQLFRAACSCKWAGSWFSDLDYVDRSFERHVGQSVPFRLLCPPVPAETL